jgi:ABC-type multidrug transport system fused ATPase/permease subunit
MWLREQIAVVSQDIVVFPKTLRENLTFGCQEEPSDEEVDEAMKAAKLYDTIFASGNAVVVLYHSRTIP